MSEQTQQQGFDTWDVMALGSLILGGIAILLAVFLPQRDIVVAVVAIVATFALAITAGVRTNGRGAAWVARVGSLAALVALIIVIAGAVLL